MKTLSLSMGAAFLAILGLAATAMAGEKGDPEANFKAMDTNQDGSITLEEYTVGAKKKFEGIDVDRDGSVSANEMEAAQDARMPRKDPEMQASHEGRFQKGATREMSSKWLLGFDTDKDGRVSASEHDAAHRAMFEQMDANRDGRVTRDEMRRHHQQMMGEKNEPKM